jgi:hypothetical protein
MKEYMIKYISFTEREIKMVEEFKQRNGLTSFSAAVRLMLFREEEELILAALTNLVSIAQENNKILIAIKDNIAPFAPDTWTKP